MTSQVILADKENLHGTDWKRCTLKSIELQGELIASTVLHFCEAGLWCCVKYNVESGSLLQTLSHTDRLAVALWQSSHAL